MDVLLAWLVAIILLAAAAGIRFGRRIRASDQRVEQEILELWQKSN